MGQRKSFTGCWTCRARRLKCDEARPECAQCQAKGVKCGGYHSRLQWLRPVSVPGLHDDDGPVGIPVLQRRRLLPAARLQAVSLDTALCEIEFAATRSQPTTSGPFSVFALDRIKEAEPPPVPAEEPAGEAERSAPGDAVSPSPPGARSDQVGGPGEIAHAPSGAAMPPSFPCQRYASDGVAVRACLESTSSSNDADDEEHSPSAAEDEAISGLALLSSNASLGEPLAAAATVSASEAGDVACAPNIFLKDEVKHLLRNYAKHVLPILSPLRNSRSPWREFHLPRALQCVAEVEILHDAPASRRALLHTILTISAYNLRNVHASDRESSRKWSHAASRYKCEALRLLETCVASSSSKLSASDYNELLAAMLCMVTIDVIAGETSTSEIHLQATETLIRVQLAKSAAEIPDISRGLHVVFLYLSTIQEASKMLCSLPRSSPLLSAPTRSDGNAQAVGDIAELLVSRSPHRYVDDWSLDMVYGVPESLFLLIRKVTRTLRHRNADLSNSAMQTALDDLEDEILDWPVDAVISRLEAAPFSEENRFVMQHYTRAFHQAVIIFYCRKAQNMNRRHVQPYVCQVMHHLEQIEPIKKNNNMCTGHIAWPAFVAGSQAMDRALQNRFARWFDSIFEEGVSTSKHCKDALIDIWAQTGTPKSFSAPGAFHHVHLILT